MTYRLLTRRFGFGARFVSMSRYVDLHTGSSEETADDNQRHGRCTFIGKDMDLHAVMDVTSTFG